MAEDKSIPEGESKESSPPVVKNKGKGVLSRVWNAIFRIHGDDFEKRLEHISKEEAAVLARMKRRSQTWRRMVVAVAYAIMTTRSMELNWKMRAFRVLPMFLLPVFSSLAYSAVVSITRMCDRRDQKTLERLRAERQAKIDELKEKTNYYTTQQLIQRYDPDPAAKAAAATVLASKLGADSGLKVYVGDESKLNVPGGKSNDVEGMRVLNLLSMINWLLLIITIHKDLLHRMGGGLHELLPCLWAKIQHSLMHSYVATVICTMGLARKEDFPYITYYCPHCHALNRPKQSEEHVSSSSSPSMNPLKAEGSGDATKHSSGSGTMGESVLTSNSSEIEEVTEKVVSRDSVG
ncbi:Uncharacterized protein TCM_036765 isoform 2 [Theobroma cacao]|uniref:Uncharacterized protein isoform 2 n=1 Tax=Theobroma cacao TaxID=3641 RepID=A0A061GJ10_THECC|nr:Uncharacterized protein TCM_036765 isoform 2 [Theobroma cacao]